MRFMFSTSRLGSLVLPLVFVGAATMIVACKKDDHGLGTACTMTSDCDRGLVCDVYGAKICSRLGETVPEPDVDAGPLPVPLDGGSMAPDRKPNNKGGGGGSDAMAGDDGAAIDDGAVADDGAVT